MYSQLLSKSSVENISQVLDVIISQLSFISWGLSHSKYVSYKVLQSVILKLVQLCSIYNIHAPKIVSTLFGIQNLWLVRKDQNTINLTAKISVFKISKRFNISIPKKSQVLLTIYSFDPSLMESHSKQNKPNYVPQFSFLNKHNFMQNARKLPAMKV